MSVKRWLTILTVILGAMPPLVAADVAAPKVLIAFGPGGPHHVIKECAELYQERHGVTVKVFKVKPEDMAQKLAEHGDLYFGGAEYMLDEFARNNPDILDLSTAVDLYPRRIGVVVREGNPLNIAGTADLAQKGIDLLAVRLENMEEFHPLREEGEKKLHREVYTGQDGIAAWRSTPELDAWVTYKSWHVTLEGESDFIEIPGDLAVRHTPMALTRRTLHRQAALHFIDFLKSPEARGIFAEHGWD
jgi:accessory colonization factor AcfC